MKLAFHVVYTALALNFWIPVLFYIVDPAGSIAQFAALGELLGGPAYPHTEDSMFWYVLGVANVATLGFCCVALQIHPRRWFPMLYPLAFLKGCATVGWFAAWLADGLPQYLAASVFDGVTVLLFVVFGIIGYRTADPGPRPALALRSAR